jgi:hypothetical protein
MSQRERRRDPLAETEAEYPDRAHIQPESVNKLSGVQSSEDKVKTLCDRLEAESNQDDASLGWKTYAAVIAAMVIGGLFSGSTGALSGSGGGGGGIPTPIIVHLGDVLEVVALAA